MFVNSKHNCFTTSKDHKSNFQNDPTVQLLKKAENELGRIIKSILDKINVNLRNSLHFNERKTHRKLSIGSKALASNNITSLTYLTSKKSTRQFRRNSELMS